MNKPRKQKDYKPIGSVNGVMQCQRMHKWDAVDLNMERKTVNCPVCGGYTSIAEGLTQSEKRHI